MSAWQGRVRWMQGKRIGKHHRQVRTARPSCRPQAVAMRSNGTDDAATRPLTWFHSKAESGSTSGSRKHSREGQVLRLEAEQPAGRLKGAHLKVLGSAHAPRLDLRETKTRINTHLMQCA